MTTKPTLREQIIEIMEATYDNGFYELDKSDDWKVDQILKLVEERIPNLKEENDKRN